MGIYPGHAPLLAETRAAPLRYATTVAPTTRHQTEDLEGGILQIAANRVLLLTGGPVFAQAGGDLRSQEETQRFDRLAGTLLAALQADPAAAWGIDGAEDA